MSIEIIADILIVAILLCFIYKGRKDGLVKNLFYAFSGIISFICTLFLSKPVSLWIKEKWLYEKIYGKIDSWLMRQNIAGSNTEEIISVIDNKFSNIIKLFEIDLQGIAEQAAINQENVIEKMTEGIADAISGGISTIIAFVVLFIVIVIVIRIIGSILNIVAHLPILNFFNSIAGILFGAMQGLLACWLIVQIGIWAISFFVPSFIFDTEQTYVLKYFYTFNLLEVLLVV